MSIAAGFVGPFVNVILTLLRIVEVVVVVWVIVSWIVFIASRTSLPWRRRALYNFLEQVNDFFNRAARPMVRPFQRLLPAYKTGGIDWSPLLLLLAINLLSQLILWGYGLMLYR